MIYFLASFSYNAGVKNLPNLYIWIQIRRKVKEGICGKGLSLPSEAVIICQRFQLLTVHNKIVKESQRRPICVAPKTCGALILCLVSHADRVCIDLP